MLTMAIWAAQIVTMDGCVLERARLTIRQGRIAALESGAPQPGDIALEDHALFPGLINAHAHLDLSFIEGPIAAHTSFADWIRAIISARQAATDDDIRAGIARIRADLIRSGTTTIGDYVGDPRVFPILESLPQHGHAYCEIIGADTTRWQQCLAQYGDLQPSTQWQRYPTPHSPYALAASGLQHFSESTDPLAIHIAESSEEHALFTQQSGSLHTMMRDLHFEYGTPRESVIEFMRSHGGVPHRTAIIHGNTLTDADIAYIAERDCVVVHCPASHRHFQHPRFRIDALERANVTIALGTDSLASCPSLDMLQCLRDMQAAFPALQPAELISMATTNAARALRLEDQCGSIRPGLAANLCAIRLPQSDADPYTCLLAASQVDWLMIHGAIVPTT